MGEAKVRVRFAPSPTGPLHIGGVRTALYNYLFARKHGGDFILRIEDTDQNRYVAGAEEYIREALEWLGMNFDEGPAAGGDKGPYRQSERKALYAEYARKLIEAGKAYYAFDSAEELEAAREKAKAEGKHSFKYAAESRLSMKNAESLPEEEWKALVASGDNVIVRLKMPLDQTIEFNDIVRGKVQFATNELDDKVILKADGMPTYHLANIVDDHLMEISHVIRGEEWLSSTAHHMFMYNALGWEAPNYAHLPLILKPTGKGKLSKRDGAKFGFPVFPLDWDGGEEGIYPGFRETGFLPDALLNFLLLLGWSSGDDQERFDRASMIEAFDLSRIIKSGARFDFDKAKWFNQQYIIDTPIEVLYEHVSSNSEKAVSKSYLSTVIELMKERVELLPQFIENADFFFNAPSSYDEKTIRKKWKEENKSHFETLFSNLRSLEIFKAPQIESEIKSYISNENLKFGDILPIIRVAIMGTMKGPDLFASLELLGKEVVLERWEHFLQQTNTLT